ncbi:hypothetical protein C8R43DRAFT_1142810 [Mycena crocata]|nr:hypothetical protein C8R43DRAFT_1142810 [Mycena crocata]
MSPPPDKAQRSLALRVLALLAALAPDTVTGAPSDSQGRTNTHTHSSHRHVPPQYSPGNDGVWRRIDSYTLVGSTVCDTCTIDPTSTTIAISEDEFRASIPTGWVRETVSSPGRTAVTVALSLSLAVVIVILILRCHFWRKSPKPALGPDLEKRRPRNVKPDTPSPKVRKWMSRATARWRDNARYLARQRKGRRHHHHSRRGSVESLVLAAEQPLPPSLPPSSPAPSIRSLASTSTGSLVEPTPVPPPIIITSSATPTPPPEPPAYPAPSKPAADLPMDALLSSEPAEDHPPYTPRSQPPYVANDSYFGESPTAAYFGESSPSAEGTAHVATDDKALLARLAERASAPDLAQGVSAMSTHISHPPSHFSLAPSTLRSPFSNSTLASSLASPLSLTHAQHSHSLAHPISSETLASTSSAPSTFAAVPHAPNEDDLPIGFDVQDEAAFEGFEWSERAQEDEAPHLDSESQAPEALLPGSAAVIAPPPALPLPTPPTPRAAAAQEKMELEAAYAARDADLGACAFAYAAPSEPTYAVATPSVYCAHEYPSAPPFPDYPEAGPSTPRRVSGSTGASAPPLDSYYDQLELDYAEEGDVGLMPLRLGDDQEAEDECREGGEEEENAALDGNNGDGTQKVKAAQRPRHAPVGAGKHMTQAGPGSMRVLIPVLVPQMQARRARDMTDERPIYL